MDLLDAPGMASSRAWLEEEASAVIAMSQHGGEMEERRDVLGGRGAIGTALVEVLHQHYLEEQMYINLGHHALVALNPYEYIGTDADEGTIKRFAGATSIDTSDLPPHPAQIAVRAYKHMRACDTDQAILFAGASGSGKTFAADLVLKTLATLATKREREEEHVNRKQARRLPKLLSQAGVLLEAFGHAGSEENWNASRFGRLTELQYDGTHRFIGFKCVDYVLDSHRVVEGRVKERNMHIFYALLAGASSEEKAALSLHTPNHFRYLGYSKAYRAMVQEDIRSFDEVTSALRSFRLDGQLQRHLFTLLAAILHLGNIDMTHSAEGDAQNAAVKSSNHVQVTADLLGITPAELQRVLIYRTKVIHQEFCTVYLSAEEAERQRDELASTLYSLLFSWLTEQINLCTCAERLHRFIHVIDLFGFEHAQQQHHANTFAVFCANYATEKMTAHLQSVLLRQPCEAMRQHHFVIPFQHDLLGAVDHRSFLTFMEAPQQSISAVLNDEHVRLHRHHSVRDRQTIFADRLQGLPHRHCLVTASPLHRTEDALDGEAKQQRWFTIRHFAGDVTYDTAAFIARNNSSINPDFVTLFRDAAARGVSPTADFVTQLFTQKTVSSQRARQHDAVATAVLSTKPQRRPSMTRRRAPEKTISETVTSVLTQTKASLDELCASLQDAQHWAIFCLKPNAAQRSKQFDETLMRAQLQALSLPSIYAWKQSDVTYSASLPLSTFAHRYKTLLGEGPLKASVEEALEKYHLKDAVHLIEEEGEEDTLFFHEDAFVALDVALQTAQEQEPVVQEEAEEVGSLYDTESEYSLPPVDVTVYESTVVPMDEVDLEKGLQKKPTLVQQEEVVKQTRLRRCWMGLVTLFTFWLPDALLARVGRMKRADVRQAWREKVTLCMIIFFMSASAIFLFAGLGPILCPSTNQYSLGELSVHTWQGHDVWVAVHGEIYDYTHLAVSHSFGPESIYEYAGRDATELFYRDPSLCGLQARVPYDGRNSQEYTHKPETALAILNKKHKKIYKGVVAYKRSEVAEQHGKAESWWIIVNGRVYDMTRYRANNENYFGDEATNIIFTSPGQDVTAAFLSNKKARAALRCMDLIHFVGVIDTRDRPQCIVANYLLLTATGLLVAVMLFKFLAALQLGARREPEEHDKFVICQVPCYTESEESLKKTIDSLAVLKYDDKRKLLLIIADGMIIGSGNDRPTPRIVLDILGVGILLFFCLFSQGRGLIARLDPNIDPEPLSFESLGEGNRQHNMGKVYTGLYDCSGHLVPFLVIAKVGKPSERSRPGNRGKRDSQLIVMRFFQKIHYNFAMSPLELEMYHQIKNVIGVDPSFYEFVLMVDADTEVMSDALNRMISSMMHDTKIMGLCGETAIANEKDSWVTMIQVYEYYISHHLAKAFESLFGSVTCLPGCFCMYRIRSTKNVPLLVSNAVIDEYAENAVDTLHKKNLLSLGEDRYLTTLMMKHFSTHKLCFTPDAMCLTVAPDKWSVLLSQRRRWINSTVHNLAELLLLKEMCGFCCFSLRFIVVLDLFATLIMPATIAYLGYLIYLAATKATFPLISLILLGAAYGLQAVIFIIKKQWQHIGWMVIYIVAMPVFSFFIPLYSFWHFDDFSWGNTRVVVGEKGGKKVVVNEEPYDPRAIPLKTWSAFEQEMWPQEHTEYAYDAASSVSQVAQDTARLRQQYPHSMMGPHTLSIVSGPQRYSYLPPAMVARPPSQVEETSFAPHRAMALLQEPVQEEEEEEEEEEYPPQREVLEQLRNILAAADLTTMTKKHVRDQLSAFFNVNLNHRKELINSAIEAILQGKL